MPLAHHHCHSPTLLPLLLRLAPCVPASALDLVLPRPRYSAYNAIWKHPESGAILYCGNADTAKTKKVLDAIGVRRIVFCQTSDGACHFERDPQFKYLKYPIGMWRQSDSCEDDAGTLAFFKPLFDFVEGETSAGNNVLIHCLAGAHRAGTASTACLMHLCDLGRVEATKIAKKLRPAIDPIGSFPQLLEKLEAAREAARAGAS